MHRLQPWMRRPSLQELSNFPNAIKELQMLRWALQHGTSQAVYLTLPGESRTIFKPSLGLLYSAGSGGCRRSLTTATSVTASTLSVFRGFCVNHCFRKCHKAWSIPHSSLITGAGSEMRAQYTYIQYISIYIYICIHTYVCVCIYTHACVQTYIQANHTRAQAMYRRRIHRRCSMALCASSPYWEGQT